MLFSFVFAMGCTGDNYQDRQWESNKEQQESLLASNFKALYNAELKVDLKTIATYGRNITNNTQKAIKENNNFTLSPKLQGAQKEWGLAMHDYNAAGKLMIQAENNISVIPQYTDLLKSGRKHADICNLLYKAS